MILRKIANFVKTSVASLDGCYLDAIGEPVFFTGVVVEKRNDKDDLYLETQEVCMHESKCVYGSYESPYQNGKNSYFGIDVPDEIELEFNAKSLIKTLQRYPKQGELLYFENARWLIDETAHKHNRYLGKYRIIMRCHQYVISETNRGKVNVQKA